jgi:uncharacterized protein YozE (UPF0346 family)
MMFIRKHNPPYTQAEIKEQQGIVAEAIKQRNSFSKHDEDFKRADTSVEVAQEILNYMLESTTMGEIIDIIQQQADLDLESQIDVGNKFYGIVVFCPMCNKKTEQSYVFNMYATECSICHSLVACMDKIAKAG